MPTKPGKPAPEVTETKKRPGTGVWCNDATENGILELQRSFRKKYGENITATEIIALAVAQLTLDDIPAPVTVGAT